MDNQTTTALNDLAPQAVAEIKNYFQSTVDSEDSAYKRADLGLKVLGRVNGNDSNRIKVLALQFQVARMMGVKGDMLRPLLAELNPALATAGVIAAPQPVVGALSPAA
jgi:hypothetical protein